MNDGISTHGLAMYFPATIPLSCLCSVLQGWIYEDQEYRGFGWNLKREFS
jgi:hypothetical protein